MKTINASQSVDMRASTADAVIHESEHVRIVRRKLIDGTQVIVKQAIGTSAIKRLQREAAMLKRLGGISGISALCAQSDEPNTIFLDDAGGVSLSEYMRNHALDTREALAFGAALARILGRVHQAGVIHKDVCPANVLIHPETHAPTLIDFNIATGLGERDAMEGLGGIAGTLSYISPEQTGRTGRLPDQRSDLYSLGVTLYEMVTGQKPFASTDLLDLVHDHLVRVPETPASLVPGLAASVSDLIMRLLEKEPDRRYQSAEGVAHDLRRLSTALAGEESTAFVLGQHDFGSRLNPPSEIIGRSAEVAALHDALKQLDGAHSVLLMPGQAGVGKSTLLAELRRLVGSSHGRYLHESFEQFRQQTQSAALQMLGRQLLAEPEDRLADHRQRILQALGGNLGIGPSLLPEFTLLLGQHEALEITDPREAESRIVQATVAILRSVASRDNPTVVVFDDVQWAPALTFRVLDAIVTHAETIQGLLVVCAYRSGDVASGHPLAGLIERWKTLDLAAAELPVGELSNAAASELVGAMLRLPPAEAAKLAGELAERTQNNPYNIIELVNALRGDNLLRQDDTGWQWDAAAIQKHVGNSSVADLLGRRLGKLPADTLEALRMLACLGGTIERPALILAGGISEAGLPGRLQPSIDDGLLVADDSVEPGVLRFSHGRVQHAVFDSMSVEDRQSMQLALARRLASQAALNSLAAAQYLSVAALLTDEAERRRAADLFANRAQQLRLANADAATSYLAAAIEALTSVETPGDAPRIFELQVAHHLALFGLGRYDKLDAAYAELVARCPDPVKIAEAARMQMYSLVNRMRFADAMALGMALLSDLGMPKPVDVRPAIGAGFQRLARWNAGQEKMAEFDRPEIEDPSVLAWASIVAGAATGAYFADPPTFAYLVLEAHRLWVEHGPTSRVLSTAGAVPFLQVGMPQDYRGAHTSAKHMVAVGAARGYEPGTSITRAIFGLAAGHWVDPVETVVEEFRAARQALMAAGDASFCSYTFLASDMLFDCEASLEQAGAEIEAGLTYYANTGNEDSAVRFRARRQLVLALRGETSAPGVLNGEGFDEAAYVQAMEPTGTTAATYHMLRAISGAIFGDLPALIEHSARAVPLLPRTPGYYLGAIARIVHCMALSERLKALPVEERTPVVEELDGHLKWLAGRAADAPVNFLHLLRWAEAERAWAAGTPWAAGAAFDVAVAEAANHSRVWHRALICERAATFRLSLGMEDTARPLMAQACDLYEAWGAAGKVKELRRQHAFLRAASGLNRGDASTRSTVVDTEMVDMMGVLRASQALSSETSLVKLTAQVGKVLGAITGATAVRLVVRTEDGRGWVMADSLTPGADPLGVEQAGAEGTLPLSAFRYAERTAQVLTIEDITRDERFSADPHAQRFAQCSVMLVPILKQGALNAMLVLENEQRRNAFSAERLESVAMIAGQLSVSLDNALLYASLEKRVAERTAQLRQKTNDINSMLQNMPQGVLTIVAGGVIHPEYSAYLETILGTAEIAGRSVMDLVFSGSSLGADGLSQVDAAIASVIGEDEMNYEFNSHLLAAEFDLTLADGQAKSLALSWSPICDDAGTVDKLMLCVRDVTELKRLEAEASSRKRELQLIGEILAVSQEKFHEFIDSARAFIAENNQLIEKTSEKNLDIINLLFRNMHTIKGNARTYGFLGLTNQVHSTEQSYDDLRKSEEAEWNAKTLLAELASVRELVEKYAHVNDAVLGRKGPGRRAGVDKFLMVERDTVADAVQLLMGLDQSDPAAMRLALQRVGSTLHMLGTQPLGEIIGGTIESLPSLARELGKEPPQVVIEDNGILVRAQASGLLKNLFTHLLRNSVDHGIEKSDARQAAGKAPAGRIGLRVHVDDGKLWIRLGDDGRGLALGKIRQRALEQNLLTRGAKSTPEEIAQLIFRSGFSTAEQVTEVSGRGVGMDAVRAFLEKEGGSIAIRFLDDREDADFRAFETVISLPDKFAASLDAEMSFGVVRARMQRATADR